MNTGLGCCSSHFSLKVSGHKKTLFHSHFAYSFFPISICCFPDQWGVWGGPYPALPPLKADSLVKDGSLTGNRSRPLFNATSRDWTASDGATDGGPLRPAHQPITADETLRVEQLVQQHTICMCNGIKARMQPDSIYSKEIQPKD